MYHVFLAAEVAHAGGLLTQAGLVAAKLGEDSIAHPYCWTVRADGMVHMLHQ